MENAEDKPAPPEVLRRRRAKGKESTQDEFFHTFNALHENHKQNVLTAERKPHKISDIADRLRGHD